MPINCIIPSQGEKLKKALKEKKIVLSNLFNLPSSKARVDLFSKYLDPEAAKLFVAKLEKGFMSNTQKNSMRNVIVRELTGNKPPYTGVSLDQAKKMGENLDIKKLSDLTPAQRLTEFSKYVDNKTAQKLEKLFESNKKAGNLKNWEEKALGTKVLKDEAMLKGELSKLEALDNLGVLTPKQTEDFMGTFVEVKLGTELTVPQAQELSALIKKQSKNFDTFMEKGGNITPENEKEITNYLNTVNEIRDFTNKVSDVNFTEIANTVIDIMRSNILMATKTPLNSALYQIIPTTERVITSSILPSQLASDIDTSFINKVRAKLYSNKLSKEENKIIRDFVKMNIRIYNKTNFDISRMETLDDRYGVFGGEKFKQYSKRPVSEGENSKEKFKIALDNYARFVNLGPKWGAGGTDSVAASFLRSFSSLKKAKERAYLEKITKNLPKGVSVKERSIELFKESLSFTPKDEQAQNIRESAIEDAKISNNTQSDSIGDLSTDLRKLLTIKGIEFGKIFIPFAKLASTSISQGIQAAVGIGPIKVTWNIGSAVINKSKIGNKEFNKRINKNSDYLVRMLGIFGAALFISSFLDDDDYIPPYSQMTGDDYDMTRAKGANPGSVRFFGQWISLRYLPALNLPLMSIMNSRRYKRDGNPRFVGWINGFIGGLGDLPIIQETQKALGKMGKSEKAKDYEGLLNANGFDGKGIMDYIKIRAIPAAISRELYNAVFPVDDKYDFLGRKVEKGNLMGTFKDDKTNDLLLELTKLQNAGYAPTISEPSGNNVNKIIEKFGEDKYREKILLKLQRTYAKYAENLISNPAYKKLSPENKKKELDKIRTNEIINPIKDLAESL
jgi:hypothetical protein